MDAWDEGEELVVGNLGSKMVADEWSMGEEGLVNERRVTGRKSTAFVQVCNNTITPEHSELQPFSSYLDLTK
jgi:hypothetical protein